MQKQLVNLHIKSETYRKNQNKMLRITVNKMLFMAFVSGFEVHSLKVSQCKIPKLKDKRKSRD